MKLTKEGYNSYIQPLIDQVEKNINEEAFDFNENILIESTLGKILAFQIEPEKLLDVLSGMTALQLKIAEKHGFRDIIEKAKDYLLSCK